MDRKASICFVASLGRQDLFNPDLGSALREDLRALWGFIEVPSPPPFKWSQELGCNLIHKLLETQNEEVLQALFGYEILPWSNSSYPVEVHIYILWDPRLSSCTEWIKRNGWGHVLFIFGGHGNKNGEILLKDGSVHPRDLFNPWLSGVVNAKVSLILNCCYGFLVAENISEEQKPLFNSVLSYSRLFPDIKDALQVQRDLLAAGMPQSWLSPRAMKAVIKTALFFGSCDFLARSIVQVQSTKNSNIILRINPVALGPISSAGWLPEILQSRFEFAKVKCENEKQDKLIQIWTELVQKKMPSAEVRAQRLKRNLFDFCPETYFTNLKSRLQRFETQEKVRFNANEVVVHQFQANYGESTLVRIIGRVNILIDGGYFNSGETPSFSNVVLDLKDNGQDVDLVILTHGDEDHWSGLPCLFKDAPPKKFVLLLPPSDSSNPGDSESTRLRTFGDSVCLSALARFKKISVDGLFPEQNSYYRKHKLHGHGSVDIVVHVWANELVPRAMEQLLIAMTPDQDQTSYKKSSYGKKGVTLINCSGLCVMIEVSTLDSGSNLWRGLFTGDCRGEALVDWWIKNGEGNGLPKWSSVKFDYVDVPHHGSEHNWKHDLFGSNLKTNAVIGLNTNGKKYGHPHKEVLTSLNSLSNASIQIKCTFSRSIIDAHPSLSFHECWVVLDERSECHTSVWPLKSGLATDLH